MQIGTIGGAVTVNRRPPALAAPGMVAPPATAPRSAAMPQGGSPVSAAPSPADPPAVTGATPPARSASFFGDGSFRSILEAVNPLQHLPVIGNLYREATGESAPLAARLAVGAATGGPIGFLTTALGAVAEDTQMFSQLRDALSERGRVVANPLWGETNGPDTCARAIRLYESLAASGP